MKITTAWVKEESDIPTLLSASEEYTFDEWGGVPDFHTVAEAVPGAYRGWAGRRDIVRQH